MHAYVAAARALIGNIHPIHSIARFDFYLLALWQKWQRCRLHFIGSFIIRKQSRLPIGFGHLRRQRQATRSTLSHLLLARRYIHCKVIAFSILSAKILFIRIGTANLTT